jgi:CD63 antigen
MAWDTVQRKMTCCGIDGPRDWYNINSGNASAIPASCCRPIYINKLTGNCLDAQPLYMDRMYQVRK